MKKLFLLLAAIGMIFTACESGIEGEAPVFVVEGEEDIVGSENGVVVDNKGGEIVLKVSTNIEYKIAIPAEAESWISVTETRAVEDVSLTIVVEENDSFESRSATVQILDSEDKELFGVTISQEGADKVFVVKGLEDIVDDENGVVVDNKGGEIVLEVSTNIEYTINIPAEAESWISVTDTRAVEDASLTIVVAENDSFESRSATVQFLDGENNELFGVTISQNGIDKQDAIQFQDPEVKRICVENWDTDEDGELSYSEASTVTDLGSLFSNSSISTFDELKYFTSLGSIGKRAFAYCSSLTMIAFPSSVMSIGDSAFQQCSSLIEITIPNNVTSIGDFTFRNCSSLRKATIADSVTSIGETAFCECTSLKSVTIPNSLTKIAYSTFRDCSSLTEITIPNNVTSIGAYAFEGCTSLTSVTISDNVTELAYWAFSGCPSLANFYGKYASSDNRCIIKDGMLYYFASANVTSYAIPDGVTIIGNGSFEGCTSLINITIPASVTDVRHQAFNDCRSLKEVYCKPTTPPSGGIRMFNGNSSGRKIYVPMASVAAYKAAEYWSDYAGAIVGYEF